MSHKRGKIVGELTPVKYYFKAPYRMEFIHRLALDAWFAKFFRELSYARKTPDA